MFKQLKTALILFALLSVLTGLLYPGAVTLLAQVLFPKPGERQPVDGEWECCRLHADRAELHRAENISGAGFRPRRVSPYNAAASSGSNLGPTNPALDAQVHARLDALRAADPGNNLPVPVDLVTASASGLDPHISPAAAAYQAERVAAPAVCRSNRSRSDRAKHPGPHCWGSWASRGSMFCSSIWPWTVYNNAMNEDIQRPDPDELLERIQAEEERQSTRQTENLPRLCRRSGQDLRHAGSRPPAPQRGGGCGRRVC